MSSRPAVERLGLESQRSRKRLFFHREISNSLKLNYLLYYNIIYCYLYNLLMYERNKIFSFSNGAPN